MRLKIDFVKYHGCGNDFIIVDELEEEKVPEGSKGRVSEILCERRFCVGADTLLYIDPSGMADVKMRVFGPNGAEGDMCGNGARCVGAYLIDKLGKHRVNIETRAGTIGVKGINGVYRVNMGKLKTKKSEMKSLVNIDVPEGKSLLSERVNFPSLGEMSVSIVNTGEPHVVMFVHDVDEEDLLKYGNVVAKNTAIFPRGTNLDLVQIINASTIKVRTYERDVWGETLACGTGATASAAVSYIKGKVDSNEVKVLCKGGDMVVEIAKGNILYLTGSAKRVYEGSIDVEVRGQQ